MVPTGMYHPTDAANPKPQIVFVPVGSRVRSIQLFSRAMSRTQMVLCANIHHWAASNGFRRKSVFSLRDLYGNQIEVCLGP